MDVCIYFCQLLDEGSMMTIKVKDPNFIGVTVKTVVLTLTTVITLCKGFQIASFIKGRDAEQITGLIKGLWNPVPLKC